MISYSEEQLQAIVAQALEQIHLGQEPDYELLCRDHPGLIEAVRESVDLASRVQLERTRPEPWIGRELAGRYRLESRLGSGAMGVVYRASDTDLRRDVAVKTLRPGLIATAEAEERFGREALALASLQHPAIVQIFDRGQTDQGDHYLVLELLQGVSIVELLSEEPESDQAAPGARFKADAGSLRKRVQWVAELAGGLEVVHERGIVHRDVKPSNVFLREDGSAVLLDFGIAANHGLSGLTRTDAPIGTPAYMPPESLRPGNKPAPTWDVYSLTATLYHLITDAAPYSGTPSQVLAQVLRVEPRAAVQLVPGLPRDLQAILDRGMARKPSDRYATAADLKADLRAFLEHRPVVARYRSPLARKVKRWTSLPAVRAVAGLLLLLGLTFAIREGREAWREARRAELTESWRRLPPNLAVNGAPFRKTLDPEHRAAISSRLDACVALAEHPVPTRLLRGGYRFDQGDLAGAQADFAAVAESLPDPFGAELRQAYGAWFELEEPDDGLPLDGLSEPRTAEGILTLAFHRYRAGDYPGGAELLAADSLGDHRYACELRYLWELALVSKRSGAEHDLAARELLDTLTALEARTGYVSAMSGHLRGRALLELDRYEEAYELYGDCLELTPYSETLHANAGFAALMDRRYQEAEPLLLEAARLQPGNDKPFNHLFFLYMETGEFERAEELLGDIPFPAGRRGEAAALRLRGHLETERALWLLLSGEHEPAIQAAERSVEHHHGAHELDPRAAPPAYTIAQAVLEDTPELIFRVLLTSQASDPLHAERIRRAIVYLELVPAELAVEDKQALALYLESLANELAR